MKHLLLIIISTILFALPNAFGQSFQDTSYIHQGRAGMSLYKKHLFKEPKARFQWDIGKSYFSYQNDSIGKRYGLIGSTFDIFGIHVSDFLNLGLGIDNVSSTPQKYDLSSSGLALIRMLDYGMFYIKVEPLINSHQIISFSLPLRIGYGGATYEYIIQNNGETYIGTSSDQFYVIAPGANVLVRLFPHLSIGLGSSYRYTKITDNSTKPKVNNYSFQLFLRLSLGGKETNTLNGQDSIIKE